MSNDMGQGRGRGRGGPIKDRTGERYDRLVAVRRVEDRQDVRYRKDGGARSKVQWLCVCDCGNYRVVSVEYLAKDRRGSTKSCGCSKYDPRPVPYNLKNPLPAGRPERNIVLSQYRTSARSRGFSWELTDEQFDDLTGRNCTYCGRSPGTVKRGPGRNSVPFVFNGIDRKDNTIGYVTGNVLPCCPICNRAKNSMSYDEFVAWIVQAARFQWTLGVLERDGDVIPLRKPLRKPRRERKAPTVPAGQRTLFEKSDIA